MPNNIYGYARVSSKDQFEDRQVTDLLKQGVKINDIFCDKLSGKDFNRPQYKRLVHEKLEKGDLLVVKSIDRLGRDYSEILKEWRFITKKLEADICIVDMPLLNTQQSRDLMGTLISDIVLQLLSFVAQNERESIKARQAEGIAAAKRRGVKFGRPTVDVPIGFRSIYTKWKSKAITPSQAIKLSNMSSNKFYRLARMLEESE